MLWLSCRSRSTALCPRYADHDPSDCMTCRGASAQGTLSGGSSSTGYFCGARTRYDWHTHTSARSRRYRLSRSASVRSSIGAPGTPSASEPHGRPTTALGPAGLGKRFASTLAHPPPPAGSAELCAGYSEATDALATRQNGLTGCVMRVRVPIGRLPTTAPRPPGVGGNWSPRRPRR